MDNNITIKIELHNNKINEIDVNGYKHFVNEEPTEEKEEINNKMENEKLYQIIVAMAKEIGSLRKECDLEWGEYDEENYKIENIIEEYKKDFEEI